MHNTFLTYRTVIVSLVLLFLTLINVWVLAESTYTEYQRNDLVLEIWEPYVWELSSQLILLLLIIPMVYVVNRLPFTYENLKFLVPLHVLFMLVFSVVHVLMMVWIRQFVYWQAGRSYDFGPFLDGFIYEFRKDIISYFMFLSFIHLYKLLLQHIQGEASLLAESESQPVPNQIDKLLVKKKGREFIVNLKDVTTIESGGNYVYIQANGETYPMRQTMTAMQDRLKDSRFVRVHRSYLVNLDAVDQIKSGESGDYEVILKNKRCVPLSRKYRQSLLDVFV